MTKEELKTAIDNHRSEIFKHKEDLEKMKASPEWADYVEKIDKMLAGWKDLEAKLDDLQAFGREKFSQEK